MAKRTDRLSRFTSLVQPAVTFGSVAVAAAWLVSPWAMLACGTADSASTAALSTTSAKVCDQSVQPSCPTTPPSYSGAIKEIISTYCLECHNPGGVGATVTTTAGGGGAGGGGAGNGNNGNNSMFPNAGNANGGFNDQRANWDPNTARDWSDYNKILINHVDMEQQVFLCDMPPSGATAMEAADRQTLLQWLACGAPNN